MTRSDPSPAESNARFRSATEFPKTVDSLEQGEASHLYAEMRECLIFTNRSRAQLVRWNDRHKQDKLELKEKANRLKGMVSQLMVEKQNLTRENQQIVSDLELEISSMAIHLDRLSDAFEPFADIESAEQSQWSFLSIPGRFFRFLQAVKSIVIWWRDEQDPPAVAGQSSQPLFDNPEDTERDRRDRPQMYTDQASVNRALLDD